MVLDLRRAVAERDQLLGKATPLKIRQLQGERSSRHQEFPRGGSQLSHEIESILPRTDRRAMRERPFDRVSEPRRQIREVRDDNGYFAIQATRQRTHNGAVREANIAQLQSNS